MMALAAVVALLGATSVTPKDFRFSRTVEAPAGWSRVELPDDVLDACRPNLPDLRLYGANGEELPFTFAPSEGLSALTSLTNVESLPKRETTATLDRGLHPPLAQAVTFEIGADEFLKPVLLEASEDGSEFREVVHGSVFAKGDVRSTTLRFAPNDRRYWRFRFDDRNSDPVRLTGVRVTAAGMPQPAREIPLPFVSATQDASSALTASLPAANLSVAAIRISVDDAAFARRVRVFERIFFRDEVSRRLVGSCWIRRTASGEEAVTVPVGDLSARAIELEVENGDSPPLHVERLTAELRPRTLLLFSHSKALLTLYYGSPSAAPARYDLASAVRGGPPTQIAAAMLGPVRETGNAPAPLATPPRGAPLDTSSWKKHQPIEIPSTGNIAYLDLPGSTAGELASLRIVDGEKRPVPYIIETGSRRVSRSVLPRVSQEGTRTILEISGLDPREPASAVTLSASAPDYFSRDVTILEPVRDARGVVGNRVLGSSRWERRPGEKPQAITIGIAPAEGPTLRAEIENGDNAPLTLEAVTLQIPLVRIDFAYAPRDQLTLITGNPEASPAHFDLEMVAREVLAAPARAAHLGTAEAIPPERGLPGWFWAAVVVAALLVATALARTLRSADALPRS
jgi:hypothetical protein